MASRQCYVVRCYCSKKVKKCSDVHGCSIIYADYLEFGCIHKMLLAVKSCTWLCISINFVLGKQSNSPK